MNPDRVKLVGEDDKFYTLNDGKAQFRVPKKGLSDHMHVKIRGLAPKMADGGEAVLSNEELAEKYPGFVASVPPGETEFTVANKLGIPLNIEKPELIGNRVEEPEGRKTGLAHEQLAAIALPPVPTQAPVPVEPPAVVAPAPTVPVDMNMVRKAISANPRKSVATTAPSILDSTAQAELEGKRQEAGVQAKMGEELQNIELGRQRALEKHMAEQQKLWTDSQAETRAAIEQHKQLSDKMASESVEIDPGRFWSSRSAPQKIAGVIGLVLGSLGASRDGVNRAAGMLDNYISQDLELQKAEHEARLKKGAQALEAANSNYSMNRRLFEDKEAAMNAAHATQLDIVASQVAQAGAKFSSPMAQAQLKTLEGQLRGQSEARRQVAGEAYFKNKLETRKLDLEEKKINMEAAAKNAGSEFVSPGYTLMPGAKPKQEELGNWRQALASKNTISTQVENLKKLIDEGGLKNPLSDNSNRAESIVGDLKVALKDLAKLGALSGSDYALIDAQIPDPTKLRNIVKSDSAMKEKLNQFVRNAESKFDAHSQSLGIVKTGVPSASSQVDAAKQWLAANPNDPRAASVRAKLEQMGAQ